VGLIGTGEGVEEVKGVPVVEADKFEEGVRVVLSEVKLWIQV
jgi:hypothetical protein